ncbi:mitochondrial import inner membrane translocase subunit Tim29 [Chelonus insularis]|uniref:mitochondrial import inner membrane translocase subunit Tim29 n=1 Tax=Chelonus insularis TaxID=460826 RepID=UPI0015890939|nr:mitochondrial import inner membrane translocase subunit Tim29 [Chelonus insularis]
MFRFCKNYLTNQEIRLFINSNKNRKCSTTEVKAKESTLDNWKRYWKGLYLDYKDVAVDIFNECKNRPIRAVTYLSLLGTCCYFHRVNPDECSFREALLQNSMRLMFVGENNRNPVSVEHIAHMTQCFNENIIRRANLGIISFIWLDNYSNHCCQYKSLCPYLKPQYINFYERIVDVGFLSKWWILEEKMKDYDVNDNEFK